MPGAGRASADRSLWLRSTYSGYPDGQASPDWHANLMRMRCLLVDDNAAFLSSARTLLDRQGVMIVGTASTSAEALRLAAAAESDYADLVAESPAAGFLAKAELSAAGIRRILAGEHR